MTAQTEGLGKRLRLLLMHIFSYVIRRDCGFAPNPFGGFLTLATCKPQIRRHARGGDWIIGTGSAATVGRQKLVYAAHVANVVAIEQYGKLRRYAVKRPSARGPWWRTCGDNIYVKVRGRWKQRPNAHHGPDAMARDLSGKNVLICKLFWHFGDAAVDIPPELHEIIKKGPGHKRIRDEAILQRLLGWLRTMPMGHHGAPAMILRTSRQANACKRSLCDLKKLMAKIPKGCRGEELDWGALGGKEAW